MLEVRQALWNRGYILVTIVGGITGFVQITDTHLHKPLKSEYRKKESELMFEKLQNDPQKVPALDWNEMMKLLVNCNKDVKIDVKSAFKSVLVTNALEGSEDYLVSDKIFCFVGESMTSFRTEMIAKSPPKTFKELINSMIPPKGIKRGKNIARTELLDGEEMRNDASEEEDDENNVDVGQLLAALSGNIPIETTSQELVKESNSFIGKTMSLARITDNEDIEKDARFFKELRKVFDSFETSTQFTFARQQIETVYQNARRTLKKKIKKEL